MLAHCSTTQVATSSGPAGVDGLRRRICFQPLGESMKIKKSLMLAGALAVAPGAASAQALVAERTISLNAALEMATASLERCRADGYKVTITVLNRHAR